MTDEQKAHTMAKALRQIIDWYENHNINHVDFRVMACHLAMDALEAAGLRTDAGKSQ